MPIRRPLSDQDAAVERQLALLRQIPAKVEAAEFMAQKFREAGRPLSNEYADAWSDQERVARPQPSGADIKLTPGEGRRGFFVGTVSTTIVLVVIWWLMS